MRISPFLEDFAIWKHGAPDLSAQLYQCRLHSRRVEDNTPYLRLRRAGTDTPYLDQRPHRRIGAFVPTRREEQQMHNIGQDRKTNLLTRHAGTDTPYREEQPTRSIEKTSRIFGLQISDFLGVEIHRNRGITISGAAATLAVTGRA